MSNRQNKKLEKWTKERAQLIIGNEAKSFGIEQTYISFTYPGYFPPPLTQLTFVPCDFTTENVVRGGGEHRYRKRICKKRQGKLISPFAFQRHVNVVSFTLDFYIFIISKFYHLISTAIRVCLQQNGFSQMITV